MNKVARPTTTLLAFILAFFFGAGLLLRFSKGKIGISQARKIGVHSSIGYEATKLVSVEEVRRIELRLQNCSLEIKRRRP